MKYFVATIALVAMLAGSSLAGLNPDCKIFVTFDGMATDYAGVQAGARTDPAAYTAGTVYIGLCDYASWTTISLKAEVDAGVSSPPAFSSHLPGGLAIGDWLTGGITLSSTGPITPGVNGPFFFFASASLFYLGVAGEFTIVDHDDYPRWVVDTEDAVDFYCTWQNGGVLMDPTPVEVSCYGDVPVEESSWGSIKALYR